MTPALDRILSYAAEPPFAGTVLDLVAETAHGVVLADHVLAALLSQPEASHCRHLQRLGWQPQQLRSIIVDNIPIAAAPARPPARITVESLDPRLVACCDGSTDIGAALIGSLTEEVRDVLSFGSVLEPLAAAFAEEGESVAFAGPSFFDAEGRVNRDCFRANALALVESIEQAAIDLGYPVVSLPQLFVGAARCGLTKGFLTGFTSHYGAVLSEIERRIGKAPLSARVPLSPSTSSSAMKRYIEHVETRARERRSEVFDEVTLLRALCAEDSELLAGYWRAFGTDPITAGRMIGAMKDDSPVNPRPADGLPDFDQIYERLCARVVGQREAIGQIMPLIKQWMAGIRFPDRPAGVALFMGPSGVGKTELTKELAGLLFGDRTKMCFIEMNTMMESHDSSRLIGPPPGYVGAEEGGMLTNWLGANPESIVLIDEIEKAHPKMFNVFLRLLSEGRIQDGYGREFDAQGVLVFMTANIGQDTPIFETIAASRARNENEQFAMEDPQLRSLLARHFQPEFIGRLKHVILFNPLTHENYCAIAKLACETAAAVVSRPIQLQITFEDDVYESIARRAEGMHQGARAMRSLTEGLSEPLITFRQRNPAAREVTVGYEGGSFVVR